MVSWCLLPCPAPPGAVACGPSRARAAQYRSKCNALLRSAHAPPPTSVRTPLWAARSGQSLMALHRHPPNAFKSAKSNKLCMATRPMSSVLPTVINSAGTRQMLAVLFHHTAGLRATELSMVARLHRCGSPELWLITRSTNVRKMQGLAQASLHSF